MSPRRYKAENEGPRTADEREKAIRLAGWENRVSGKGCYVLTWTRGTVQRVFEGGSYDKAIHASFEGLSESGELQPEKVGG
ncbi:hypothetical protein [Deinococcus sp. Leaf326]|uniref:hypothetical protein n=1 Tax=Deinococcus sp. Leaf326 TaxID=1736338 RepID=UPI0006F521EA|nr:hypothetical protein [Deinococcus sp. Leaf326]KQR37788.1 hypothetical protein ASF71_15005 [Deinococcus sp. Leaf326]